MKHLNYDPGKLTLRIRPGEEEGWIGAYDTEKREVYISSDWLDEQFSQSFRGSNEDRKGVLEAITLLATHEAAHQFGYENPDGDTEGCGNSGVKCHGPVGSGSVTSYDHHKGLPVNYEVTEEDVRHIPDATYNEDDTQLFTVSKNTDIGEYGVWIRHTYGIEGKTNPGSDRGNARFWDVIFTRPFRPVAVEEKIPTFSATYSGTDNLLGVDMSEHNLGALLRADVSAEYTFNPNDSKLDLTIDSFETYDGIQWNQQNGYANYELLCQDTYCLRGYKDSYVASSFFHQDSQYTSGVIRDRILEYNGSFVAERD